MPGTLIVNSFSLTPPGGAVIVNTGVGARDGCVFPVVSPGTETSGRVAHTSFTVSPPSSGPWILTSYNTVSIHHLLVMNSARALGARKEMLAVPPQLTWAGPVPLTGLVESS